MAASWSRHHESGSLPAPLHSGDFSYRQPDYSGRLFRETAVATGRARYSALPEQQRTDPHERVDRRFRAPLPYRARFACRSGSVANIDSPPLDGHGATSAWNVGDYQFDSKTLDLPVGLPVGIYTVGVKVYWYVDQKPLPVQISGGSPTEYYPV